VITGLFQKNDTGAIFDMEEAIITHASCIAAGVGRAFSRICLRSKGQRSRSHGYENRHGRTRTVATDVFCYGHVLLLPACFRMSIWLPMFSSFHILSIKQQDM